MSTHKIIFEPSVVGRGDCGVMFGRKFLLRKMTLMNDSVAEDHQCERPNGCASKRSSDILLFRRFFYPFFSPCIERTMLKCSTTLYLLPLFLPAYSRTLRREKKSTDVLLLAFSSPGTGGKKIVFVPFCDLFLIDAE